MENSDLVTFAESYATSTISENPAGDPMPCIPLPSIRQERGRGCSRHTLPVQGPSPQLQQALQLLRAAPLEVGSVLLGPNLVHFPLQLGGPSPGLCCPPIQRLRTEFKMVLPIVPILPEPSGAVVLMHFTAQDHLQGVGLWQHSQLRY